MAALAFGQAQPPAPILADGFRCRGRVACALALVAVGFNYSAIAGAFDDDSAVAAGDDPVAEVVNLGT